MLSTLFLLASIGLQSPSELQIFMGDHGTNQIKGVSDHEHTTYMREYVNETSTYYTWHIGLDDSPKRLFWWTRINGKYGVAMSHLDGNQPDFFRIPESRSVHVDSHNNRVYFQAFTDSTQTGHSLFVVDYDDKGLNLSTKKLVATAPSHFSSLVVNPDNCGALFWIQISTEDVRTLMRYRIGVDPQPQATKLNSAKYCYMKYVQFFAVDPKNQTIYWGQNRTDWQDDAIGKVSYATPPDTYTTKQMWIYNKDREHYLASYPGQLAIDYEGQRVYWVDMNRNWIASASMEGDSIEQRDMKILDHYPVDLGSGGPNYHPTSLSLIRFGQARGTPKAPGKDVVFSNSRSRPGPNQFLVSKYDEDHPPVDPTPTSSPQKPIWSPFPTAPGN